MPGLGSDLQRNMCVVESEDKISDSKIKICMEARIEADRSHAVIFLDEIFRRFTEERGFLLSPFWPNNYLNSESCFYDIMLVTFSAFLVFLASWKCFVECNSFG